LKAILYILKQNLLELTNITKVVTSLLFFLTIFFINLITTDIETFDCMINNEYFDNSYLCVIDYYAINFKAILLVLDPEDVTEVDEVIILGSVFLVGHLISSFVNLFTTEPLSEAPTFQKEFQRKEFNDKEEEDKYYKEINLYKESYLIKENKRKKVYSLKIKKYKNQYNSILYFSAIFLGTFISLFFINWGSVILIIIFSCFIGGTIFFRKKIMKVLLKWQN